MVRSNFRRRWVGIIEGVEYWSSYKSDPYPIYRVKPVIDPCGRPQPKSVKSRTLAQGWLEFFESNASGQPRLAQEET